MKKESSQQMDGNYDIHIPLQVKKTMKGNVVFDNTPDKVTMSESEEKLFILDTLRLNKSIKIDEERYYPEASVINIIKQVIMCIKK